jgi:hypothetical protein
MSNIENRFENPKTLPLKERLNKLNKGFPKSYKDILEKAKNSTIKGVINLASELKNRELDIPESLNILFSFSLENGMETIKLQEGLNYNDTLNESQHKALINGWVTVLQHISSIHKIDSENKNQRLSDKQESKEHYNKSKEALNKLKLAVDTSLKEDPHNLQQIQLMNDLEKTFPYLKDSDLSKWEKVDQNTQKLDFKIKDSSISILFNKNESLPFTINIDGKLMSAKLDNNVLIKSLKNIFQPVENLETQDKYKTKERFSKEYKADIFGDPESLEKSKLLLSFSSNPFLGFNGEYN